MLSPSYFIPGAAAACSLVAACLTMAADLPFDESQRDHWSLRPRIQAATPIPDDDVGRQWLRTPVDAFVLERLRKAEFEPSAAAERSTLARRVCFDLIGLPPAPDDVELFVADGSPDAYERLVDRLLASPRCGERQTQQWLDVVRYAETEGFEYDQHRPGAWRYRDYIVASLNADKPFDTFAREQLAGDELPRTDEAPVVAAGFHRLGPVRRNAGNSDVAFSRNEVLTEMTDAVGVVFLGLTVGCARCHDHKFDPIRQVDYYRLQAYLASTNEHDVPLASPDESRRWNDETTRIKDEIKRIREAMQNADGRERERLVAQLQKLEGELPPALPTLSSVRVAADQPAAVSVLQRGQSDKPLQSVGPRPLGVLVDESVAELTPKVELPKSKLADWILAPEHPLTSRVLANRLWQAHFGTGLVATPNDFGVNGAAPSHPELLDDLANRLVAGGWRLKPLHRLLVTSAAYRQSSHVAPSDKRRRGDPENRWLSRFTRRRLDAEQLRDSLLTISGEIDLRMGGPSVMTPVDADLVKLLYKPSQWEVARDVADHHRRSIYLIAKRNLRLPALEVFDQPDLAISCGRREASTHAPQALELLNGVFSNQMAVAFSRRLEREGGSELAAQVDLAFRWIAARPPSTAERAMCSEFMGERSPREFALAMFNLNAFLYID